MAKRWGHTQKWVINYLKYLKSVAQIDVQKVYPITLITIVNYEKYQSSNNESDAQNDAQKGAQKGAILNKDKKVKNVLREETYRIKTTNGTKQITEKELDGGAVAVMTKFNRVTNGKTTSIKTWKTNLAFWLEDYTLGQVLRALDELPELMREDTSGFWTDMTLTRLFRTKNKNGSADYLEQLLNRVREPND
jgi:hypothetical protein